jgi:hypothetical protein
MGGADRKHMAAVSWVVIIMQRRCFVIETGVVIIGRYHKRISDVSVQLVEIVRLNISKLIEVRGSFGGGGVVALDLPFINILGGWGETRDRSIIFMVLESL